MQRGTLAVRARNHFTLLPSRRDALRRTSRAEQPSQQFTFLGAVKIVRQSEYEGRPGMTRTTPRAWAENHALMQDTGLIRQFGPRAGHAKEEGC